MTIQELLGAVVEERTKLSNIPSSPSRSAASSASSSSSEALRCPRCDSSNTKFCYYNNYNLTQPRHFCKTCRRYWTKGGALRNVPIGGGCRKAKPAAVVGHMGRPGSGGGVHGPGGGLDHHDLLLPSSPLLWASRSAPHSSHLLALLRASQPQPNQSHNPLNYCVKEESAATAGAHMSMGPLANLCRNEQLQYQQHQNVLLADTPTSSGVQDLYQRLRAPANCGGGASDNLLHMMISSNGNSVGVGPSAAAATVAMATATAAADSVMEPMPLASSGPGEFGYWNPALPWADLPTANGAFP